MKLFPKSLMTGCVSLVLLASFQLVGCKARVDGASGTKDLTTKTSDGNVLIFYTIESDKDPVVCMVTCSATLAQHFQEKSVGYTVPKGDTVLPGERAEGTRYCEEKMNCLEKKKFYNLYLDDSIGLGTLAAQKDFIDVIIDPSTLTLDPTINNWVKEVDQAMDKLAYAVKNDPKMRPFKLDLANENQLIERLDPSLKANLQYVKDKHTAEVDRRQKVENDRIAAEQARAKEEARIKAEAAAKAEAERVYKIEEARRIALQLIALQPNLPALSEHANCSYMEKVVLDPPSADRIVGGPTRAGRFYMSPSDSACFKEIIKYSNDGDYTIPRDAQTAPFLSCSSNSCSLGAGGTAFYGTKSTVVYKYEFSTKAGGEPAMNAKNLFYAMNIKSINNAKEFCTSENVVAGMPRACLICMDSGDHANFWCQTTIRMSRAEYDASASKKY